MSNPIVYVDTSKIREGKFDKLKMAMKDLAAFVEANMPRILSYAFFLNDDQTQMTVVAIHPDSASLEFHLDTGAAEFRKFATILNLLKIDVYGRVSESVISRLEEKAEALGSGTLTIHEFYAGFTR
jgi:hypothetical protein